MFGLVAIELIPAKKECEYKTREEIEFENRFDTFREIQSIYSKYANDNIAHRVAWLTVQYAKENNLPPLLVSAVILEESRVKPMARGLVGEIGLMQIHPKYWRGVFPECGNNLWNIRTNICYGTRVLRWSVEESDFDLISALHGYNGRVRKVSKATKTYTDKVLARLGRLYLTTFIQHKPDSL